MHNPEEKFMREALKEAQAAAREGEVPVGAVIACQGHIIARAHNLTQRLNDPTAHAGHPRQQWQTNMCRDEQTR